MMQVLSQKIPNYTCRASLFGTDHSLSVLILTYSIVFGFSFLHLFSGITLIFCMSSVIYALAVIYLNDPLFNQAVVKEVYVWGKAAASLIVLSYVLVFGIASFNYLSGQQLLFFMLSYIFAISIIYLRDLSRLQKHLANSLTFPIVIDVEEANLLIIKLNETLPLILGNSELLLNREYEKTERHFMIRDIYENALNLSQLTTKIGRLISDSPTKPK